MVREEFMEDVVKRDVRPPMDKKVRVVCGDVNSLRSVDVFCDPDRPSHLPPCLPARRGCFAVAERVPNVTHGVLGPQPTLPPDVRHRGAAAAVAGAEIPQVVETKIRRDPRHGTPSFISPRYVQQFNAGRIVICTYCHTTFAEN